MGIALWIVAGCMAFAVTRAVGIARTPWPRELAASIVTACALGVVATGLDFGGWNEADWRAGLFAGLGGFTAIAIARLLTLTRAAVSDPAPDERSKR